MTTKLRTACDVCHQTKVRCSGQLPCQGCQHTGSLCIYSLSNRLGRPKGTKNRPKSRTEQGKRSNKNRKPSGVRKSANRPYEGQILTPPTENTSPTIGNYTSPPPPPQSTISEASRPSFEEESDFDHALEFSGTDYGGCTDNLMSDVQRQDPFDTLDSRQPLWWDMPQFDFPDMTCTRWDPSANSGSSYKEYTSAEDEEATTDVPPVLQSLDTPLTSKFDPRITTHITVPNEQIRYSCEPPSQPTWVQPSPPPAPATCLCLQQHADLLCGLKEASFIPNNRFAEAGLPIDVALSLSQKALDNWRCLIACPLCANNDEQEVILLVFMSIRAVIRIIQRASLPSNPTPITPLTETPSLTLGTFTLPAEDQLLVLRMLLMNALRKMKCVLGHLKEILERMKKRLLDDTARGYRQVDVRCLVGEKGQAADNLCYIQQMFQGLVGSLVVLERGLSGRLD